MVPIWSPPCQPYHTVQRYTIATQKTYLCTISYQSLFTSMPSIPYIGPSKQYHTICRIVYNFKPGPPSPSHQIGSMSHLLWRRRVTSSAICWSVSKSTLCRPVVRYHLFVILHHLSNSFCDNGNKRFFEVDLPIDVLSPACEQKRAAKLEIALDSHLPCHP